MKWFVIAMCVSLVATCSGGVYMSTKQSSSWVQGCRDIGGKPVMNPKMCVRNGEVVPLDNWGRQING